MKKNKGIYLKSFYKLSKEREKYEKISTQYLTVLTMSDITFLYLEIRGKASKVKLTILYRIKGGIIT